MSSRNLPVRTLLAVPAALAVLAYLPSLSLPLISEDYTQIWLARRYGPLRHWPELAADPLYRCRATSIWVTYAAERIFGSGALVFKLASLALHIVNVWLVLALGAWRAIGWRVAAAAAAFFAVHEGHQEAVIWHAALPELLVFLFGVSALLCWIRWVDSEQPRGHWYPAALVLFVLALLSKESAVALVPLLGLAGWTIGQRGRRLVWGLVPFAVLAALYAALSYAGRQANQHYSDGTFSLDAPFWVTLPHSALRMLWIWGLPALVCLLGWRSPGRLRLVAIAAAWMACALLPYSFLTYMNRVPSRHTYLASVAVAWLVGAALLEWRERVKPALRWAPAAVATLVILHNCAYLWTKKQQQYLRRAAPVQALIEFARQAEGPVRVRCFVYGETVARHAIEIGAAKPPELLVWAPQAGPQDKGDGGFCDPTEP